MFDVKGVIKKWESILNEGKQIKNPKVLRATAIMLENEQKYVNESVNTVGALGRGGDVTTNGDFYNIAVPMVRRTFPELIAHDIVGVQPMTGPVGLAFALRYRAGQTYGGLSNVELGYNSIDRNYSLTTPATSAEELGSRAGTGVGDDFGLGIGIGTHIKEVGMTIEKVQIEAKTRKLRSRWSLEVAQDLKAMHSLDLEEEMMDILAYEITAEIDREIVETLKAAAVASSWDFSAADGRWEVEKYRNLYNLLIRKSNEIAVASRRGAGNFVIAHPTVCAAFETLSSFVVSPVQSDINTAVTGIARIGSLDGRINVYRDTFETSEIFTVGFKGSSQYDCAVVYAPYISLMSSRATFEDSFNPTMGLMSRYAIVANLMGAGNYLRRVTCSNMP